MPDLRHSNKQFNALQQAAYQLASCTDQLFQQIEQQQALASIIDKIRSSLDLDVIFKTTATEIRQLLNADRVGAFRFDPQSGWDEGEFVAEDVAPEFPSAMAAKVYDHCFGSQFAVYYTQGRVQAVADIYNAGLSDCHIQILEQFRVRANLIVPVLKGEQLWGLLCIHQCSHSRRWQLSEIEFVRKIADHFAIALQQAEYLEQIKQQTTLLARSKAREQALVRQKALVKIVSKIRQSLDFASIGQTATEEVRQLLEADRVAIYRFNPDWSGDFLFESVAAGWTSLVGVSPTIEDTYLMETQGGRYANNETFAVADIYEMGHSDCHVALLEEFQARAYAIAPIFQGEQLWGLLAAFQNSAPRHWREDEVELLAQIGEQLAIALQQAESIQQIEAQSVKLKQTLEELHQSQIQLIHNEKMASLGQLVAGIAHEINNPIGFIYGNLSYVNQYVTDLLKLVRFYQQYDPQSDRDIQGIQKQAEEVDIDFILEDLPKTLVSMKVGANRIRDIVLSLRNFLRLDEAEVKIVDIHEGIDSTLLILGHRMKTSGDSPISFGQAAPTEMLGARLAVQVIKDYGDIPRIKCYPAQLNQVFMNLLANALDAIEEAITVEEPSIEFPESDKATPRSRDRRPTIWIATRLNEREQVEICIRDNGIGIEEKNIPRIFDRFFTTKYVGKGTGLGLAASQQIIVEKHGGTLQVNSTLGEGAEFKICLPINLQV